MNGAVIIDAKLKNSKEDRQIVHSADIWCYFFDNRTSKTFSSIALERSIRPPMHLLTSFPLPRFRAL